ncbi:MAG: hypothetical protein HKN92_05515 [Chitinophagales bacterium]|nr:hypothetical protein [Chitinophagales bacterium]
MLRLLFLILLTLSFFPSFAQDDLMDLLESQEEERTDFTTATFKTTRIINSHSVETLPHGEMNFIIGHRFGRVNSGIGDMFGLDNATIRLGFEYGVIDDLTIGIGRSSNQKIYDGFLKYKLLKQSSGKKNMPVSLTLFSNIAITTIKFTPQQQDYPTSTRLYYSYQILLARKFNKNLSIQLSPTLVHRNLVETREDVNDVFLLGAGGRYKITNSLSVNGEYFFIFPNQIESPVAGEEVKNMWALGIDLETGGHIFQLQFTNSRGMVEKTFLTESTGRLFGKNQEGNTTLMGEFHFGFNINRIFTIVKRKS